MSKRSKKADKAAKIAEASAEASAEAQIAEASAEIAAPEGETPEGAVELSIGQKMAAQLRAARPRYKACTTANGNKSLFNGDAVAQLLEARSVEEVFQIVEGKLGLATGSLAEKYGKLNPGQKRMNAGNLLRNAAKRGEVQV